MEINKIKAQITRLAKQALQDQQVITPFIKGVPGIGKSQIIKQIAEELGFNEFVDLRMSEHDDTDIKGIPSRINGIFEWVPPEFIPVINNSKFEGKSGILFLDEINRASQETLQSIFEVVQDYNVGGKALLPHWFVICAGNLGYEDGTQVTELDSALMNRFAVFTITENDVSLDDWIKNFAIPENIHPLVIEFLQINPRFLYYKKDEESLITPRSWEKFSKILSYNQKEEYIDIISNTGPGIIYQATTSFLQFYIDKEERNKKMSPEMLLNAKEEVIKEYVKDIDRDELYRILTEVVSFSKQMKKIKDLHLDNFRILFESVDDDQKVAIIKSYSNDGKVDKFIEKFLTKFDKEYNDEESEFAKVLLASL